MKSFVLSESLLTCEDYIQDLRRLFVPKFNKRSRSNVNDPLSHEQLVGLSEIGGMNKLQSTVFFGKKLGVLSSIKKSSLQVRKEVSRLSRLYDVDKEELFSKFSLLAFASALVGVFNVDESLRDNIAESESLLNGIQLDKPLLIDMFSSLGNGETVSHIIDYAAQMVADSENGENDDADGIMSDLLSMI